MKRNIVTRFWVVIGILALAGNASGALSVDEQVKMLAERYRQVEDQLARSIHCVSKSEPGGATTVKQEWYNGAEDLIKLAMERNDASGRELTEYIPDGFDSVVWRGSSAGAVLFKLTRKEAALPDGGVQVDEFQKYFGRTEEGAYQLIRELRKSARFKPGEPTDTVHVPNVVVDVSKQTKVDSDTEEFLDESHELAPALRRAGPPQFFDPFANVKGDSDKFRVIHGSVSPDGRYAIALGFARKDVDWKDFLQRMDEGLTEGEEGLRNYVVDLASQKILGETGCNYFGTSRRYNHRQCVVRWSPDSLKFVELWNDKWASSACVVGKINPGPKFTGAVDLNKAIENKTYAFVKKHFDPELAGSLSLHINKVSDDGIIDLDASEINSGVGEHRGETIFAVNERLCLGDGSKGPRLEILKMRRLPND